MSFPIFFSFQMKMSHLLNFNCVVKLETPKKQILKLGSLYSLIPKAYSRCFGSLFLNMFLEHCLEFIHVGLSSFLSTKPQFSHLEPFRNSKEATQVKCHDGFIRKSLGQILAIFYSR